MKKELYYLKHLFECNSLRYILATESIELVIFFKELFFRESIIRKFDIVHKGCSIVGRLTDEARRMCKYIHLNVYNLIHM